MFGVCERARVSNANAMHTRKWNTVLGRRTCASSEKPICGQKYADENAFALTQIYMGETMRNVGVAVASSRDDGGDIDESFEARIYYVNMYIHSIYASHKSVTRFERTPLICESILHIYFRD